MAMQGGTALQEEVIRMLSRKQKKPVLKPNNKPLSLKDEVANRKIKKGAMWIIEMSMMMACWKQNNFADTLCSNEMQSFYKCCTGNPCSRLITHTHPTLPTPCCFKLGQHCYI
uniref:Uncharacterized protein n=1 Tax=Salmo trutta TaxID=8032 RepID=A0A674CJR4_SALTR